MDWFTTPLKRFATDRLDDLRQAGVTVSDGMKHAATQLRDAASQYRDGVIVPAIDTAMEEGNLPGDVGMYGRYLTGTQVPLTKFPADVRTAEQAIVNKLLELNGESFDPQNYKATGYSDVKGTRTNPFPSGNATTHTLGQYLVEDGIVLDRYDFDKNNGFVQAGTTYWSPRLKKTLEDPTGKKLVFDEVTSEGQFEHGGIFGQPPLVQDLANLAGNLSQRLGLVKPGSGYDVRLDTGRR